ncbi:hypothetical protein B0H13DRAFT_2517718 [Mycena leptocephala]|nr:hypothetical protein B0H13DRAFT_2517718 [Mycena leptocephala]
MLALSPVGAAMLIPPARPPCRVGSPTLCVSSFRFCLRRTASQPSVPVLARNTETTASSWTRTTCGACNGRPLLSFCILPRGDVPLSTSCTYGRLMLRKIVLGSGSGSDDRAVGRVRATAPARSPSSLLSPSVLCPCPSILSSSPHGTPSQRGFLGLACAVADPSVCGGIRVFIYSKSRLGTYRHTGWLPR